MSRLPAQFGKYSILGHLATGGMAEVYLARAAGIEGFEKIVVIKRIRPELIGDQSTTGQFLDEARLVATLEHHNVAQVYEIGLVNDSYFFVMEYVHGADLRQVMERSVSRGKRVALADALYIMIDVCTALHYAHDKHDLDGHPLEIIHRDVSPSNVLISHDGAVKVCDFGIAKATARDADTMRGVLKGKFAYMSPEQCRGQALTRASDIFSIGILLFELTTLTRLFQGDSDYEILRAIVEEPVPSPLTRDPDYPPDLARIVMKALARDPAERYPTAQAMQLELEAFAREQRLALSSVNIARMMGGLFERRIDAWLRAQDKGKGLGDHLIDTAVRSSDQFPVFLPLGSAEAEITVGDDTPPKRASVPKLTPRPGPAVTARRRPSALWLVGALAAAMIAVGVTVAGGALARSDRDAAARALDADAERIAGVLDSTARAARLRADGLASTPVLRNAIETDAATFADLASGEGLFRTAPGESIEVFQATKAGPPQSVIRVPPAAAAIAPVAGQDVRIEAAGGAFVVTAGAPISAPSGAVKGSLAVAMAVDLKLIQHYLAPHAVRARIAGLATDVELAAGAPAGGAEVHVPIVAAGIPTTTPLTLIATPVAGTPLHWVDPVRYGSAGLAGLLLIVYTIGLSRGRSRP